MPILAKLLKRLLTFEKKESPFSIFSFVFAPWALVRVFPVTSMFWTLTASIERFLSEPVDSRVLLVMLTSFFVLELLTIAITAAPLPPSVPELKSFLRTVALLSINTKLSTSDNVLAEISSAVRVLSVILSSVSTEVVKLRNCRLNASVSLNLNNPLSLEACISRLFPERAFRSAVPAALRSELFFTLRMDSVSVPRAWNMDWNGMISSGAPVVLTT